MFVCHAGITGTTVFVGECAHMYVSQGVRSPELRLCLAWLQQFVLGTPQAALDQSCWAKIPFRCLLCRHICCALLSKTCK